MEVNNQIAKLLVELSKSQVRAAPVERCITSIGLGGLLDRSLKERH